MNNTKIIFVPERGGLGDGIVGCSSAFILSKVLNAEFKVKTGLVQFYNYFDIPDHYKTNENSNIIFNYEPSINHDNIFKNNYLSKFKNKSVIIKAGSNFSRFLYKNILFENKIDINETDVIQYLFKNILIPKKQYLEKLDYYVTKYDIHNSVGIQLRMLTFNNMADNPNPLHIRTIDRFIECFKKLTENNKLILITDNLEISKPLFENNGISDIVNIEGNITHSIRHANKDYEKTLLDMLIIGECKHIMLSYWSNFGRIGVLRTKHKSVWLIEPEFKDMNWWSNRGGKEAQRQWRDVDDPSVIEYRSASLKELLSKEQAFV